MSEYGYIRVSSKEQNEARQLDALHEQSIDSNISELNTCQSNVLVNMQKTGYGALRNIISALPDGYMIPFERR